MSDKKRGTIAAATSLNFDRDENTLMLAKQLATSFDMNLHLTHALDWFSTQPWISHVPGEFVNAEIAREADDLAYKEANRHLNDTARRLSTEDTIQTNVVRGHASKGVIADALSNNASLIIAGAANRTHRFTPRGFSTAMRLMTESPIPVLVINQDCQIAFDKPSFRVLIADNLADDTVSALTTAFAFANQFGNAKLFHVHVHGNLSEQLKDTLNRFWEVAGSLFDRSVNPGDLLNAELERRRNKMAERVEMLKGMFPKASASYTPELMEGDAGRQLIDAAKEFQADLVVYGRHKTFHRDGLFFGQVPIHEMLAQECGVLVVPDGGDQLTQALRR